MCFFALFIGFLKTWIHNIIRGYYWCGFEKALDIGIKKV
jgi:hypothetical protein